jgi:hypothetical protein
MDAIQQLVPTKSLKTSFIAQVAQEKPELFFNYNDESDTLMLLVIDPDNETIVHYLDKNVAVLYTPDNLEIVGLQVEDFVRDFMPHYNSLKKAWSIRNTQIKLGNVWDLRLVAQEKQFEVALEVVRAVKPIIGQPATELEKAFEYAC